MNRLPPALPLLATFVLAALMSWMSAQVAANVVESLSFSAVRTELDSRELTWVDLNVDGLEVTLAGTANSEADRFRALSVAGEVIDPTRLIDDMAVTAAALTAPKFSAEILRNDDGVSLIGLIPDSFDSAVFADSIVTATKGQPVTNLLQSAKYPAAEEWTAAMDFALTAIELLPRSKISVSAGKVVVTALAESENDRNRLLTLLRRRAPSGLDLSLDIAAPRPAITPFTLRFVIEADKSTHFDACSADTAQAQSAILAAARAAGMQDPGRCTIGLGSPSPRWGEAAVAVVRAVGEIGGGTATMSDTEIALEAPAGTDRVLFDTVIGKLDRSLPPIFKLDAVIAQGEDEATSATPATAIEVVARKDQDGKVFMRGQTGDAREQAVVDAFARGMFGAGSLSNVTRVGAGLPEGWALRVLAGLEALSRLDNGQVIIRADKVALSGETGRSTMVDEVTRLLTAKLGQSAQLDLSVRYVEKLDPTLGLPTPLECVERINAVLTAEKLKFAPGSGEIEAGSANALNNLAAAFKDCDEVPMEVAGHTDSQGRDEMNLQLSQSRAESVIAALMARRVLTGQLTARGYGETQPISDNDSDEGRETNRRIEFRLVAKDGIINVGPTAEGPRVVVVEDAPAPRPGDAVATNDAPPDDAAPQDGQAVDGSAAAGTPVDTPDAVASTSATPEPLADGGGDGAAISLTSHPELAPDVAPEAIPKPRPAR